MKKNSIFLTILLFCATSIFAQKISFQAVVRNNANELVPNTTLTVAVSVLDASNNVQYSENHTGVQTNQNGLLSLMVGDGTPTSATTMADVVWSGASIRTVITLPGGATITNTTPVNAVPYALSAGNVDPAVVADAIADYLAHHSVGGEDNVQADWEETDPTSDAYIQHKPTLFDGDYNSLSNKPTIPTVPANVSEFNNDAEYVTTTQLNAANYITAADVPAQVNADWNATGGAAQILNKPTLATVATSGSYNDLSDKPTIPTVPANVSEFNNDANYVTTTQLNAANYITAADVPAQVNADWDATSGAAQIFNKPTIPTVPTDVSEFNNDAQYVNNSTCDTIDFCSLVTLVNQLQTQIKQQDRLIDSLNSAHTDGIPCPGSPTVTDYDGNVYATVKIGYQCWMAENLRTTHYADGTAIPLNVGQISSTVPYRYYPNNDSVNVKDFGYLYNYKAAISDGAVNSTADNNPSGKQGVCPTGWHMPSRSEWNQMFDYINGNPNGIGYKCDGSNRSFGKSLAAQEGWELNTTECSVGYNQESNNLLGFNARPAGYYSNSSSNHFPDFNKRAIFWHCTYGDNGLFFIQYNYKNIGQLSSYPSTTTPCGYSVRCVRDYNGSGTTATLPSVTTSTVSNITTTTATSGGNITSDGGATISARGVCWSTSENPTVSDNHTIDGTGTGSFTSSLSNLTEGTTYHIRAYATNSEGTAYGEDVTFTTLTLIAAQSCPGTPTVTDKDGNTYNTVLIGEQCWMRENMKTTKYADGTPIPVYTGSSQEKFYYNTSNTNTFGLLYNWKAAMNTSSSSVTGTVQGICPTGWHIPSTNDYSILTSFVNTTYPCSTSGENALAATTDWLNSSVTCSSGYNLSNNNASGFSALPAGGYNVISNTSGYTGQNTHAYFWCSDTDSYSNKKAKNLQYDGGSNFGGNNFASSMSMTACSVRCLRD